MSAAWQAFDDELLRWQDAGRRVDFWWRDDDAATASAAFLRLASLARQSQVPLALAAIPERAEPALFEALAPTIAVLQHGVDHRNRAPREEKAAEFVGSESPESALDRLEIGRARLAELAGTRFLPVLVPPWNRFPVALIAALPRLGIRGLSTFAPRHEPEPAPGLRQVNSHVDIIAWKRGRSFVGEERALAEATAHLVKRRSGEADSREPTGWLTHHERHDETIWAFLEGLFERTSRNPNVRWLGPADVFLGGKQ